MNSVMTSSAFVQKAKDAATKFKTLYVTGGWGAPASPSNKKRYINSYAQNAQEPRKTNINKASADTFFFDCVCLLKGILWGWVGDASKTNGGAIYGNNEVVDCTTEALINKYCTCVSDDFSNIQVGEILWMQGHVGVYIGDGLAVECTPKWENKVQITSVWNIKKNDSYNGRIWTKHGKCVWINYLDMSTLKKGDRIDLPNAVTKYSQENWAIDAKESKSCGTYLPGVYYVYKVAKKKNKYAVNITTDAKCKVPGAWVVL